MLGSRLKQLLLLNTQSLKLPKNNKKKIWKFTGGYKMTSVCRTQFSVHQFIRMFYAEHIINYVHYMYCLETYFNNHPTCPFLTRLLSIVSNFLIDTCIHYTYTLSMTFSPVFLYVVPFFIYQIYCCHVELHTWHLTFTRIRSSVLNECLVHLS